MKQPYYLIKHLTDQLTTPDSNMQAVVLADDPKTKVVLFSFAPGSGLTEHVAPFDTAIQIVSGIPALMVWS